ncbi:sensor histidine kinase [Streptomyces orinoci]|uniref:histidine kinase n=1 Tax=Streptomyces orinoci TaxID=67339 RepID=A0ABV3JUN1_STRON|nr:histidine kinase [Streptomyces orinoci]
MVWKSRVRRLWLRLTAPEQWSRRRTAAESTLATVLALLGAVEQYARGLGWVRVVLVALLVAAVCLVRRVLPATALIAAAAATELAPVTGCLLLIVAGGSAGRRIDGALRALAAFGAAFLVFEGLPLLKDPTAVWLLVFNVLLFLVITVVPGLAHRYWSQRRTLLHTLRERNLQLLREREMVAGQARMRERQRIAQDMHDSLGHQLALIAVQTGALEVSRELTDQQREAVGVLRQASVAAMHELRAVVGVLKDGTVEDGPVADERPAARVVAAVDGLVESATAAGLKVRTVRSGEPRPLGPAADHAGYRVVQEGLTNASKHAPGAPITVGLHYEPDSLVVEVANGPAPAAGGAPGAAVSGGQGLTGLRERVRLAGGMVHAGPTGDGGFRLAAVLPYPEADGTDPAFAEAGDELGGPGRTAADDGVPVTGRSAPSEEFKDVLGPHRSKGCLIGIATALFLLVGLVLLIVAGVGKVMDEAGRAMLDPGTYAAIRVGSTEDEVRHRLPSGKSLLTSGLKGKGPAVPAGASCLSLLSTDSAGPAGTDTVYRFCFRDGKLIEKREFRVKND